MVARCSGYKKDGTPCSLAARGESVYCWAHDPEHQEQRTKNAVKGGKARAPAAELVELRGLIRRYMDEVEKGKLEKGKASVLAQLAGVAGRLYEAERRIVETEQLAAKVAELEDLIEHQAQRGVHYGA
jgi:multidrug efflux pump subunit AcrA (membrane-fusion protein)